MIPLLVVAVLVAVAVAIAKGWAASRQKPLSHARGPSSHREKARPEKKRQMPEDDTLFQEYANLYEKRYLAYLIAAEAERRGADMEAIDRLRKRFGKELLPPPYGAQRWLRAKGVALSDILRMQGKWIRSNGGNPDILPALLEVERIVKDRNLEKARNICREAGID